MLYLHLKNLIGSRDESLKIFYKNKMKNKFCITNVQTKRRNKIVELFFKNKIKTAVKLKKKKPKKYLRKNFK